MAKTKEDLFAQAIDLGLDVTEEMSEEQLLAAIKAAEAEDASKSAAPVKKGKAKPRPKAKGPLDAKPGKGSKVAEAVKIAEGAAEYLVKKRILGERTYSAGQVIKLEKKHAEKMARLGYIGNKPSK